MAGHMHLMSRRHLAAASGIVGAAGPAACGFALAHQQLRPSRVAVAFFGEGAMNQGMLLESLNLAGCWRLPVLFVCKDNGIAITTASPRVTAGRLPDRVRAYGIPATEVDGADAEAVWTASADAVRRARRGDGPSYLHATCVRPEGHFLGDPLVRLVRRPLRELRDRIGPLARAAVGPSGAGVRGRTGSMAGITGMIARAAGMRGRDPVSAQRRRLTVDIDRRELEALEQEIERTVRDAVEAAVAGLGEVPA
jgi:pyruvate dehydrogenase E1 component alpha subunit